MFLRSYTAHWRTRQCLRSKSYRWLNKSIEVLHHVWTKQNSSTEQNFNFRSLLPSANTQIFFILLSEGLQHSMISNNIRNSHTCPIRDSSVSGFRKLIKTSSRKSTTYDLFYDMFYDLFNDLSYDVSFDLSYDMSYDPPYNLTYKHFHNLSYDQFYAM